MKRALLLFGILLYSSALFSADKQRSDSIDIKRTILHCDITDFVTKQFKGHANILVASKINGQTNVVFDLEGMQVDSVKWNNAPTPFSLNGFSLSITSPSSFNQGDTAWIDIYYQGIPIQDPTWGGYYNVGNYSFQMGVGFNAQPHSVGRFWHPCFDNMVERSPYEFYVITDSGKMGVANGIFLDSTLQANGTIVWHYKLDEHIPSYLAAVAVSDYVWVKKTLNGNLGITPAWIAAEAVDTNKVNGSFANLQSSFSMLEQHFGTHSFPKVGYTLVPFNAGAMEHATNIHIGSAFINGSLTYETLIAHELTHHWWGDLVTCRTVEDMWLNEGWASYGALLHTEYVYGTEAYRQAIRENHYSVLSSAHIRDNGYKAISPMDSLHTYGPTVYDKGADYIHTLRSILGDSLFFNGTTAFLNANKFKDISSEDLRDFLTAYTGKDMTPFFNDFIFQSGFPHYSIDSAQINLNSGLYKTNVFIRHRKHQAPNYYSTTVPLEIGFYDPSFNKHIYHLDFSGRCMQFSVNLPFEPLMIVLDPNEKISDACTENEKVITSTGFHNFDQGKAGIIVSGITNTNDSSLLRIEHHWIAPDRFSQNPSNGYVLNDKRYWKISGINLDNLKGVVRFQYDGTSSDNYIDSTWLQNSEDSIRMFYRKDATQNWTFANDSLRAFAPTDKKGFMYLKEIKAGEYCYGIQRSGYVDTLSSDIPAGPCTLVTNTNNILKEQNSFTIYPNPNSGYIAISSDNLFDGLLSIYDLRGALVHSEKVRLNKRAYRYALPPGLNGMYIIKLQGDNILFSKKIVIRR